MGFFDEADFGWGEWDDFRRHRVPSGAVWVDQHGEAYYHTDAITSSHLANIVRWLRRKLEVDGPDDLKEISPLLTYETLDKMMDAAKRRGLILTLA